MTTNYYTVPNSSSSIHSFPWKPWCTVDPHYLTDPNKKIFSVKPDFELIFKKISATLGNCDRLAVISNSIIGVMNWHSIPISCQYEAISNGAAVFEASAMFYYRFKGPQAEKLLNYLTPRDIGKLKPMECMFVVLTNEIGAVDDEAVLLRISEDEFLLSSGGCKPLTYLSIALETYCDVNVSYNDTISFNIKGPQRFNAIKELIINDDQHRLDALKDMSLCHARLKSGEKVLIVRTNIGMEMWGSSDAIALAWDAMLISPETYTVCGWDMLNSFRMDCDEFQFSLYPLELNHDTTLWEVGLGWMTYEKKTIYVGKRALESKKNQMRFRINRLLFDIDSKLAPFGSEIFTEDGCFVGIITSSAYSFKHGYISAFAHIIPDCHEKIFLVRVPSEHKFDDTHMKCHLISS